MRKHIAVTALALLVCSASWANNRCVGADGKVTYQDTPCPSSARQARRVELVENTVDGQRPMWRGLPAPPVAATLDEQVRITCADAWPGDHGMQVYCQRRQVQAFHDSQRALNATPEVAARIRLECERAYPGDYSMRVACHRVEEKRARMPRR